MRLAVFFPASLFSAWACSYGLVDALRRMGHEVTSVPVDPQKGRIDVRTATSGGAGKCEAAIISGPEHIAESIGKPNVPTVAWLHETVEREDYGKLDVDAIKRSADIVFCPAIQDEKYGFRYLPFGVDTEIFTNAPTCPICDTGTAEGCYCKKREKSIPAAFIGLLYPKRQAFLKELRSHGVTLATGNVQVLELGGINPRKTAELYAENIRKIKVFVNLPTLSQLAVTKIYEVLACGTPILTPEVTDMRNLQGLPVIPYRDAAEAARILKSNDALEVAPYRDDACNVASIMQRNHCLELRCEVLLSALKEARACVFPELVAP